MVKKSTNSGLNLDIKLKNCSFPVKNYTVPDKKSTNTRQNLDVKLKNSFLYKNLYQKIKNSGSSLVFKLKLIFCNKKIEKLRFKNGQFRLKK